MEKKIFDPFEVPEMDIPDQKLKKHQNSCNCGSEFFKSIKGMECMKCGMVSELKEDEEIVNYVTPENYEEKTASIEYRSIQKNNTYSKMRSILNVNKDIDEQLQIDAAELYFKIQQLAIKRASVRDGTMAAAFYKICKLNNKDITLKKIADIFKIPQKSITTGIKIIEDYESKGLIKLDYKPEKTSLEYLQELFNELGISDKKEQLNLCVKLVEITQDNLIGSNTIRSKCLGSIYYMIVKKKLNINPELIISKFNISKGTLFRFVTCIESDIKNEETEDLINLVYDIENL